MANGERRMFFALGVIFGAVAAIFGCKYGPAIRAKAKKLVEDQTNLLIIKECCDSCGDIGHAKPKSSQAPREVDQDSKDREEGDFGRAVAGWKDM